MKYFVILIFLAISLITPYMIPDTFGLWIPLSPEDLLEESKTVFVGTVTGITLVDREYQSQIAHDGTIKEEVRPETITLEEYTVNIEEFLKNPQDYATTKVLGATVGGVPGGPSKISGFDIGDRVLFYLPKEKNQTHFPGQYLPESFKIPQQCDANKVLEQPRIELGNSFNILQNGIAKQDNFTAGIPMEFVYSNDMYDLSGKSIDVEVSIRPYGENEIIFEKKLHVESEPCTWITSAEWEFTPKEGNYRMYLGIRENENGESTTYTGFSVISENQPDISPLKQFHSGASFNMIKCKSSLVLVGKYDGSPACVKPETKEKLIERDWTTQSPINDMAIKTMSKNLGPECAKNTINDIMSGNVDDICSNFLGGLAIKHQSEMIQKGYAFDNESNVWTKEGYPDILMTLEDDYRQNLNYSYKPESLDIATIEGRYIHLNPVGTCATVSLELMSPDEINQRTGAKDVFLEFDDADIQEMPILDELIRATHHLEFLSNEYSQEEIGLRELVDYEFFIMKKSIEKYGDTQEDYFMKLDNDLDERLEDPRKQGFSNEFIAPQIIYKNKVYVLSGTVFWVSDEHEMQSISVNLRENLNKDEKFVALTDEDMKSIPKIRQAIESIGTTLESVVAFKGVTEDPDWNEYTKWYDKKSAEQFDLNEVYVHGFVYKKEYYDLGFLIC